MRIQAACHLLDFWLRSTSLFWVCSRGNERTREKNRISLSSAHTHSARATVNFNSTINNKTIKKYFSIMLHAQVLACPCPFRILRPTLSYAAVVCVRLRLWLWLCWLKHKISILYARIVAIFISFACQCRHCCRRWTKGVLPKRTRDKEKKEDWKNLHELLV